MVFPVSDPVCGNNKWVHVNQFNDSIQIHKKQRKFKLCPLRYDWKNWLPGLSVYAGFFFFPRLFILIFLLRRPHSGLTDRDTSMFSETGAGPLISKPTTGAGARHARSYAPRSCERKAGTRQTGSGEPWRARLPPMRGAGACPGSWGRKAVTTGRPEWRSTGAQGSTVEGRLKRGRGAAGWRTAPEERSPWFPRSPCPALPCREVCSPRCRRSSSPWSPPPGRPWGCWWSPGRTDAFWGWTASTCASAQTWKIKTKKS